MASLEQNKQYRKNTQLTKPKQLNTQNTNQGSVSYDTQPGNEVHIL